jgi:hypothetical protein
MSQIERDNHTEKVSDEVRVNWRCAGYGQIPCKAYAGRYEDQRWMALDTKVGKYSFYLGKELIIEENGEGEEAISWVRVRIVEEVGENLVIELPVITNETDGYRIVVPQEIIKDTKVPRAWVEEGLGIPSYMRN